jgi:hypothetical protein
MKMEFFKKRNSFKKKNFQFNPNLFWKLALGGSLILILGSFFFSYRLLMKINEESVLPMTNTDKQVPTVKADIMEKVLRYFSVREQKSAGILNSPSPFIDPSL